MKLLLERGANPADANPIKHILDREDPEGLRILLAAGAGPNDTNANGETGLHWAVWRGRSAAIVAMLLDAGAAIDARRNDGATAYAMAVQSGQTETAALLAARGADTTISDVDRYLAACASASPGELEGLLAAPPALSDLGPERLLADLAMENRLVSVRALLAAGAPVDSRGQHGGTALHWACWKGYPQVVDILLKNCASLAIEDREFHATPPGWFAHGLQNCGERDKADYPTVARLLVAAGAQFAPADIPTGVPAVDAVLREHGVLEPQS